MDHELIVSSEHHELIELSNHHELYNMNASTGHELVN